MSSAPPAAEGRCGERLHCPGDAEPGAAWPKQEGQEEEGKAPRSDERLRLPDAEAAAVAAVAEAAVMGLVPVVPAVASQTYAQIQYDQSRQWRDQQTQVVPCQKKRLLHSGWLTGPGLYSMKYEISERSLQGTPTVRDNTVPCAHWLINWPPKQIRTKTETRNRQQHELSSSTGRRPCACDCRHGAPLTALHKPASLNQAHSQQGVLHQ